MFLRPACIVDLEVYGLMHMVYPFPLLYAASARPHDVGRSWRGYDEMPYATPKLTYTRSFPWLLHL